MNNTPPKNISTHPARLNITLDALGVAEVCLVRADKMNALDPAMFEALVAAIAQLKALPQLRAVVLYGEGKAFCAGLDMASFAAMSSQGDAAASDPAKNLLPRTQGIANNPQHIALGWRELAVPVIAAVQGVAFGGGLQLALGVDIRLVTADTKMSFMEMKWGLVPDMAGMVLARGLVRDDVLRELIYTGRIAVGADAVQTGLATRVCDDPLAEARALASSIAARSPTAVRAAKRLANLANQTLDAGAAQLLLAESAEQAAIIGSPNQTEAVAANLGKRAAVFANAD
jgi:enoyl-CoA hydratase/carnithine racemase